MKDEALLEQTQRQLEELQRQAHDLALAQGIAHLGSWIFDVDANAISWSDEMFRIYGIAKSDLTYERYLSLIHPDDRAVVQNNVARAFETGSPFTHEHRIVRPDGTERIILGVGEAERDDSGRVVRMVGTAQDITSRREAEQRERQLIAEQAARAEAEAAATRLSFIADASIILASSIDYEETLQNVARLAVPTIADWCAVDIVTEDNVVRRLAVQHSDPSKVALALEIERRYPTDPNARTGVPNVLRTGQLEWLSEIPDSLIEAGAVDDEHLRLVRELGLHSYAVAPLMVGDDVIGAITFVHAESRRTFTAHDLTLAQSVARRAAMAIHNARLVRELSDAHAKLRSQSEELEAQASELEEAMAELELRNEELVEKTALAELARAEAEQANASKSQFLANMSHELRTPLNAIGGYAELLELGVHGPVTDAQVGALERIKRNQRRLIALINDLLNFVKLRAGRLEITLAPEPLHEILDGILPLVEPQVKKKELVLSVGEAPLDLFVYANRERVEQVLLNLISNAVKFTPTGGSISVTSETQGRNVMIHVTDSGIGIAEDQLAKIFEPFVQLSQSPARDNQGVGLGLAISRDLMNGMGGDLEVESRVGAGSRFTMILARATPAAATNENEVLTA
jgi:PAS domain S-box-containing protein